MSQVKSCDAAECAPDFQALGGEAITTIPDSELARRNRRLIWLRAAVGEFICTTCFLFTAFCAVANLKRTRPVVRL
jgi:hypothetical protein